MLVSLQGENVRALMRPWLIRAVFLMLSAAWLAASGSLSRLDRWGFDQFLRLRHGYAGPVSPRIAHLDIGQKDLQAWASTRQEYSGLAELIGLLRDQGAQVIVLDLLLLRGEDSDFAALWKEILAQDDVVLGRTFSESTRLPPGRQVSTGLLYLNSDSDGILRSYEWARRGGDKGEAAPSLALAAYLKLLGQSWRAEMLGPDGRLHLGEQVLPGTVLLDERANWSDTSPRNFFSVEPSQLRQWSPAQPHLAGKVVFVGYVAPGTGDVGTTPLNQAIPKVGVHALALNGLIQNAWFVPTSASQMGVAFAALALLAWGVGRMPRPLVALVWGLVNLGVLGGGVFLALRWHQFAWLLSLLLFWTLDLALEVWLRDRTLHARLVALQVMADSEDPLLLKVVGKYQMIRKLGQGGFASVYQAVPRDTLDPARSVALKIVHPASAENPDFRRRFMREVRISTQLRHQHIVKVHGAGEDAGLLYMIMELLEGRPLKHYLQLGEPCSVEEVLQVLRPLLEGLAYAHDLKVVHRDLKPDNLMVRMDSEVHPWRVTSLKIVDFGLAFDSQASQLTRSGEIFGTLDYLAPERIQGRADDPRSDLYAVGVLAYEMLTGKNPFQQQQPGEAILFRLTADPPGLSELRPELPTLLAEVVARLMARDPEERFASAREVLTALSEL